MPIGGSGEGALGMAEQFALGQVPGDGGAVQRDERPVLARRELMDRPSHEFLAGAALAGDQGRAARRGDQSNLIEDLPHGFTVADDP